MGRPPRTVFEGALYHLTTRGNNRRAIFRRVRDRLRFLDFLGEVVTKLGWICYSYCLMTNHFHLVIETPQPNMSIGMQRLNGRYARYFNYTHKRMGHAFEKRFHPVLVEKESHLLEVCRYVPLNPVRAGICQFPEQYRWSSYRATVGLESCPPFLAVGKVLALFGDEPARARANFAQFTREGIGKNLWDNLKEGKYLGSEDFAERMKQGSLEPAENVSEFQQAEELHL